MTSAVNYQYNHPYFFVHCNGQTLKLHSDDTLFRITNMVKEWLELVA